MAKMPKTILTTDVLPEIIKQGISGAYVFFGEEDYLKTVWLSRIEKAVMTAEGFELFNRFSVSFSDERAGAAALADALFAAPMMQEKTLVDIRDISVSGAKSPALDEVCRALQSAGEDTVIIIFFRSDELVFDYRTEQSAIFRKLSAVAKPINFDILPDAKLSAWIKKLLSERKLTITPAAISVLLDMCSSRMYAILGEVEKLSAYKKFAGGNTEITDFDVKAVCTQNAKDEIPFAMSDAASRWSLKEILGVFEVARDRQDEPLTVVAQLGRIYTEMLRVKAALDAGMTPTATAKALGMNEYRAGLVCNSVKNVPVGVIENAVLLTYETDVKLKSTQTDKWVLLDELAAKIYTPKSLRGQDA